MPDQTEEQDFQPILDAQRGQLDLTISASDSIDAKALAVLAASLTLAIFSVQSLADARLWLLIPMFGGYLASIVCNIIGFRSGDYIGPGVELSEHPEYLALNHNELVLQLISDAGLAIALNSQENDRKRQWLQASFILTGVAVLLMIGCILKV